MHAWSKNGATDRLKCEFILLLIERIVLGAISKALEELGCLSSEEQRQGYK